MVDWIMQLLPAGGVLNLASSACLALIFFVASFVFVPRTFLCLGVGAIFGLPAILIILPSTTLGGMLAFLAARYLIAEHVQRYVTARPQLRRIALAVDEEGWRVVALLRFASPLPNALQNYMFGLTQIRLLPFVVASFIFTIPQIVFYVYFGSAGSAALRDDGLPVLNRVLIIAGLTSLAVVLVLVIRRVRRDGPLTRSAIEK